MTIQIPKDQFQPNLVLYPIQKLSAVTIDVGAYTEFAIIDSGGTTIYSTPSRTEFWHYLTANI